MKKTLTLLCLSLFALTLRAVVYTPTTVPIAHLADSTRYVCNPDGILSESACRTIDAIFRAVEDSTGVQALVAVLGDIEPADCFTFARELGEHAGVGRAGKDDGIVILLSTTEREIRIVPGYGLEGVLPDAICKRVEVNAMVPSFAEGDWDTGMVNGARALMPYLLDPELASSDGGEERAPVAAILGFLLFPLLLVIFIIRREKRCPACGKYKIKQKGSETLYSDARGRKIRSTYVCKNCGHTHHRDIYISKSSGPTVGGGFGGTIGGGFGGGSIGGHYGGGHFGGGGAGTRF